MLRLSTLEALLNILYILWCRILIIMCENSNNNTDKAQDEICITAICCLWEQKDITYREIDPVMFYKNFRHCI